MLHTSSRHAAPGAHLGTHSVSTTLVSLTHSRLLAREPDLGQPGKAMRKTRLGCVRTVRPGHPANLLVRLLSGPFQHPLAFGTHDIYVARVQELAARPTSKARQRGPVLVHAFSSPTWLEPVVDIMIKLAKPITTAGTAQVAIVAGVGRAWWTARREVGYGRSCQPSPDAIPILHDRSDVTNA